MSRLSLLALGTALLGAHATSQNCGVNAFPLHLVTADGIVAPISPPSGSNYEPYSRFSDEAVYAAFDPATPSGTYYIHVTSPLGTQHDAVLSTNDPMDRFVTVQNNGGVISLSLPFTNNPNPALFGAGLNGQGQSVLVAPYRQGTGAHCEFAVWAGDTWELSLGTEWPYIVRYGFDSTLMRCAVASYSIFRVGDGTGSDVSGTVFADANHNADLDAGEGGVANLQVQLVGTNGTVLAVADANGRYSFANVPAGSYSLELITGGTYVPTSSASKAVEVCGCGDIGGQDFGVQPAVLTCNPREPAFWRNSNGAQLVQQKGILPTLPALHLVCTFGHYHAPGNLLSFRLYLALSNSLNMGYSLSTELLAMHCNVMAGFVDPMCVVNDPALGAMTVGDLMATAIGSLAAHPRTFPGHPQRAAQTRLKNALLNANKNRNWL